MRELPQAVATCFASLLLMTAQNSNGWPCDPFNREGALLSPVCIKSGWSLVLNVLLDQRLVVSTSGFWRRVVNAPEVTSAYRFDASNLLGAIYEECPEPATAFLLSSVVAVALGTRILIALVG
ncbi:hypothetical protein AVEN_150529-1 [Araneus ventricosus]|uniref:Uncharacterized protein n=1 Tax=Araneus ventricosus TaxID=182803 RepID=A0A4Y2E1U8_ARAVE|nr:hypothetical protein AVEN_150529-1 [Araneus ventricosus]